MFVFTRRRAAFISVAGAAVLLVGGGFFFKLRHDVRNALQHPPKDSAPLSFRLLPEPSVKVARWGGGGTSRVALTPDSLFSAGAFGLMDGPGKTAEALPTLRVSALTLWREQPLVGLEAGGLYLRRADHWEELRTGFGTLHVRDLVESPGGELFIGAREGLFKTQWGSNKVDRVDPAPVQSMALGPSGVLLEGGETGLRKVVAGRVESLPSPDPWIQWVGVQGDELTVLTPMGLAQGSLGGTLVPLPGFEGADSAVYADGALFATSGGHLLRREASGRSAEWFLPSKPKRVMAASGILFVDTEQGLYRRVEGRWVLARPRPYSLPGSGHVSALAQLGSKVVVGLFDEGIAVGNPGNAQEAWRAVSGSGTWGVNALLASNGTVMVASLRGVSRFDGQRLRPLGKEDGAAFALALTPAGVAVGYAQGVALPEGSFLSAFHGLPGNQALALLQDPGGLLFVGTPTGLGAIRGSRVAWRITSADGELPNAWVNALVDYQGTLFVGTYGGGVTRRKVSPADSEAMGTYEPFPETEGLKVSAGGLVAVGDSLLLGTDGQGLYRLSADGTRFVSVKVPLPSRHITAILPLKDNLLIGTDEGLALLPFPIPGEGD